MSPVVTATDFQLQVDQIAVVLLVEHTAVVAVLSLELVVAASLLFLDRAASASLLPVGPPAVAALFLVGNAFGVPLVPQAVVYDVAQVDATWVVDLFGGHMAVPADIVQKRIPPKRRSRNLSPHPLIYISSTLANKLESC